MSIWNGDPGGHRWPRQQSFITLCTPRSFFQRLLSAERTTDVQHRIYDEVHDASSWELFLLSHDLYELSRGMEIKIYLMTATTDTVIFAAITKAVTRALQERTVVDVDVPSSSGTRCSVKEIPAELLPDNFEQLSWGKQVCHCITEIISWATKE